MSEPNARWIRWVGWAASAIIGIPVLYVAGSGPAYWAKSRSWTPDWLDTQLTSLYAPLEMVCDQDLARRAKLHWYQELYAIFPTSDSLTSLTSFELSGLPIVTLLSSESDSGSTDDERDQRAEETPE